MEKFKKLLEHWIEHNEEHLESYRKWMKELDPKIAEMLKEALEHFEKGNEKLKMIRERLK
ncbi:MAG: hypothetical protein QXR27_01990 [Archaeoglobaceae archaeon]